MLPHLTGAAIADYVRSERPQTTSRRVFVRHVAPVDEPVAADVVRRPVRQAYRRAGLPYTRVHILRHTLASRLLNTGGTLKEVADVLRHRELDTSLIYAKVDFGRLGAVAKEQREGKLIGADSKAVSAELACQSTKASQLMSSAMGYGLQGKGQLNLFLVASISVNL